MHADKNGWRVKWREGGRQRARWFKDRSAARKFELERELGIIKPAETRVSPRFSDFAAEWVRTYCKLEKAESQWAADERVIKLHLNPAIGEMRLIHLRQSHLLDLKAALRVKMATGKKHALSPKTVNLALALAKKIMATAYERELVGSNPFAGVRLVRLPPQRFRFWTAKERDRFLAYADGVDREFARLVRVACHTGLRLGELAALERADLDFERRKIRVSKTWDVNLGKMMPMTKGRTDEDVPMNREVIAALEPVRFLQGQDPAFDRSLFWSARKRLGRLAEKAKVPDIRFHDLRHTFASTLAMAGVDLMLIKDLCRHKSYQMTLRYAHLHPDHRKGATDVLCSGPKLVRSAGGRSNSGGLRGT